MRLRATRLKAIASGAALGPAFQGVLDTLTVTSAGAYSLRRTTGAYRGPLIRVRRSSDNAERDIGYTITGDLNTATLLAFVGSASGFVSILYDQSPAANHALQTNTARQPRIVNAGVLDVANGRASQIFDGVDDILLAGATSLTTSYTVNGVEFLTGDGGGGLGRMVAFGSDSLITLLTIRTRSQMFGLNGTNLATAFDIPNIANRVTTVGGVNAGQTDIWHSGVNAATSATGPQVNFATRGFYIGNTAALSRGIAGGLPEVTLFSQPLSTADRQTLERNQGAYFGLTVA